MDDSAKKKSGRGTCILYVVGVILLVGIIGSCIGDDDDDPYTQNLHNGLEKYENNEPMTKQEHDAVKDFNEWEFKQNEHTYDEWENN